MTNSGGGGNSGSSLTCYTIGNMGAIVSLSVALAMAVVVVLVADVVGLTGVVILLQRVGDRGVNH